MNVLKGLLQALGLLALLIVADAVAAEWDERRRLRRLRDDREIKNMRRKDE